MKCNICGKEIISYGNNPFPLCQRDDFESCCCDDCNSQYVIMSRLATSRGELNKYIEVDAEDDYISTGDTMAIFYSVNSDAPINCLLEQGKILGGVIDDIDWEYEQAFGSWGNFGIDLKKDTFMKVLD